MDAFPAFVPLRGARVVIVGEGEAADAKARLFEGSPAELVRITDPVAATTPSTYTGAKLAFIALADPLAQQAVTAAHQAGVLINVVDRPDLCDFHTPSIVDRGAVVGAIGTAGAAPLLASRLRTEWEARWPEGLGRLAGLLAAMRAPVRSRIGDMRARRAALTAIMDGPAGAAALAGDMDLARRLAAESLDAPPAAEGRLVRIAAPTDPEDLTVRHLRALARADRVIAEPQISPALLAHARRDAIRLGAAEDSDIALWTGAGETVVVISPPASPQDRSDA